MIKNLYKDEVAVDSYIDYLVLEEDEDEIVDGDNNTDFVMHSEPLVVATVVIFVAVAVVVVVVVIAAVYFDMSIE